MEDFMKFIMLTEKRQDGTAGKPVVVNFDHVIELFADDSDGTVLLYGFLDKDGTQAFLNVREDLNEVMTMVHDEPL